PSPARGEGLDLGGVGRVGQRQARSILSPHRPGTQAVGKRTVEVARLRARHRVDPQSGGIEKAMTPFLRKLSWLARRRQKETELEEELQFHLDEETDERNADGFSIDDQRRAA